MSIMQVPDDDVFRTLPLLGELTRTPEWKDSKPLAGLDVHLPLHFFDNLVAFSVAGTMLGLDPTRATAYFKGEGYRYIDKTGVKTKLLLLGMAVRSVSEIDRSWARAAHERAEVAGNRILVVEDGGYASPIYALNPDLASHVCGIVEQTSRGARLLRDTGREPSFAVLSVPDCELKKKLEPDFVADGIVRAIQAMLPNRNLRNLKVAVLGLGDLGRALVIRLAENCSPPAMFDPDPVKQVLAKKLCGRLYATAVEAIRDADVVVGVTGHVSITADLMPHLKHGVVLVSSSSNDTEFDKASLQRMALSTPLYRDGGPRTEANRIGTRFVLPPLGKNIDLLSDGYPVNFWGDYGGMGDDMADLVLSMMFVSMIEIAQGTFNGVTGIVPGAVDELVRKHNLCGRFLRYHS